MSEKRDERSFRIALRSARCPKCKGKMLEIQRPKVVCSQCEARYILAVQTGTFLIRSKLIEDIPAPPPQVQEVKETITKEVVLIPCQYCGGLMPQTATFCPNCGARRKG
jgi:exosome complex RNA-binding protein Csl4